MADLEKMILAKRENGFGGFMNYMTNKYGGDDDEVIDMSPSPKKKSKKRPLDESTEEPKKNKKGGSRQLEAAGFKEVRDSGSLEPFAKGR